MIPVFPEFKKLALEDKVEIEKLTSLFPPYSDFNFTSMWSWDTKGKIEISNLFGNLVLKFSDYITSEPFYTFLGTNKVNESAKALLDLSKEQGFPSILKLIPEDSTAGLDRNIFSVVEDNDNFDYMYLLEKISTYNGNQLRSKRNLSNRFLRNYSAETTILNMVSPVVQKHITDLFFLWAKNKKFGSEEIANELLAIQRAVEFASKGDLISIGIFVDEKLIGFVINEIVRNDTVILHFEKADESYVGVYAYLMAQNAKILLNLNKKMLNYEQDLGIPGLKLGKKSYYPTCFLKKYIVSYS